MRIVTRYFKVADLTIQVNCDLPILENTFASKFNSFETDRPGEDTILINHYFKKRVSFDRHSLTKIYYKVPWIIYRHKKGWVYQRIHIHKEVPEIYFTAFLNFAHTRIDIYHQGIDQKRYLKGNIESLTLFPTDQVLLARVLADRKGCFFHSNGIVLSHKGVLLLGHSGFGKSTLTKMLESAGGKTLCDDRMIVREFPEDIKIYGNWCHGKEQLFSTDSSSLNAMFFLHKSQENRIISVDNRKDIVHNLLSYVVRPLETKDWWANILALTGNIAQQIPCYNLLFDKSGRIVPVITELLK